MITRRETTALVLVIGLVSLGTVGVLILTGGPTGGDTTTTTDVAPDPNARVMVSVGNTTESYNFTQLKGMDSVTGWGGYKKTTGTIVGPYTYTGVPMLSLLSSVGTVPAGYSLEVRSRDGYTTYLSRAQVEGRFEGYTPDGEDAGTINCTLLLAYYEDNAPLESGGPLRIVTMNEDGNLTDGRLWAKDVINITLIDEVEPWQLELHGIDTWNMTHDEYYSAASCAHHNREIAVGNITYSGVALWTIVAAMDCADDVHFQFNDTLATEGYDVVVFDGNGKNVTISSASMAYNYSIILAGWVNQELLTSPDWPLALVTPAGVLISNIVSMQMVLY